MASTQDRRYLTAAETAKLVRKHLRADFPGIKFSVRSKTYAGGASIDVRWTDGPLTRDVDAVLSLYNGATFDGMIDLKSYHDSLLMTDDGPQVVHFGADFVHSSRDVSDERMRVYWRELERFAGQRFERPQSRYEWGTLAVMGPASKFAGDAIDVHYDHDTGHAALSVNSHAHPDHVRTLAHRLGLMRPWKGTPCPGGDGSYCPGCGRWQADHRGPHLH